MKSVSPSAVAPRPVAEYRLTTEEFAKRHQIKQDSLSAVLCRHGSYHGIVPLKLPTRRLLWPDVLVLADGRILRMDGTVDG